MATSGADDCYAPARPAVSDGPPQRFLRLYALEDRPDLVSPEDIKARFGAVVLRLVLVATDTPAGYAGGEKPPWRERKEAYLRQVRVTDPSEMERLVGLAQRPSSPPPSPPP
jgi:hypothetical protein